MGTQVFQNWMDSFTANGCLGIPRYTVSITARSLRNASQKGHIFCRKKRTFQVLALPLRRVKKAGHNQGESFSCIDTLRKGDVTTSL